MIHKFSFDNTYFVLDSNSGALHVIDELAWELIEDYLHLGREDLRRKYSEKYPLEEVEEALNEIEELIEERLLFSEDPFQGKYNSPDQHVVKALCLHLAHACNLACRYCFAGQGCFNGPAALMPWEVGRQAIDFLMEASGSRQHVEVDFFGGEPLLNFKVMQNLVLYGREKAEKLGKQIKFTVTTNAILLNEEAARYLYKNNISVVLSLDGRPDVHDKMRTFPGGKSSSQKVLGNILRFISLYNPDDYYVRGTFTRHNLDFANDVLYLADLGFSRLSIEPVVAPESEDYALRSEDLPLIFAEYERLTRELLKRARSGQKINFFHFNVDLEGGPCLPKRLSGCSAGCEYLAVTPEGFLYPCHQFVGRTEYLMGDVWKGVTRPEIRELFRRAHVYNKEECSMCWARFLCSGGCHANAEAFNGTIYKPYKLACEIMQKRLECALYLYWARQDSWRKEKCGKESWLF